MWIVIAIIVILIIAYKYKQANTAVPAIAAVVDANGKVLYCSGGIYCNGEFVPKDLTAVGGAPICGAGGYKYMCVDSLGTPRWRTDRELCDVGMAGKC